MPGRSGTVYKNWLEERGKDFRAGVRIATLDPFQGYKNAIDDQLQDATSVLDAFHIVRACQFFCVWGLEVGGDSVGVGAAASSKTRPDTADARVIPSTKSGFSCAPCVIGSRSVNKNDSMRSSRQMRRISVSKSPTAAPSKSETSSTKPHPPKDDA